MQGIQSLMPGQAQQAPLPGMMPKPGAATPPAVVAGLEMLPSQQLLQIYSQKPSLQVLAALDKAYKREELGQSMRGQQAMQQAAQPGTVADQVVSQIANRGIAQFSGGGAVAFEEGGQTEDLSDDPSLPLMERIRRSQRRMEMNRQQGIGRPFAERFPREAEVPVTDTGDESERLLRRAPVRQPLFSPEAIALMQRQGPRGIASVNQPPSSAATRGVGQLTQASSRAQPSALNVVKPAIQADMTPEERQFYESQRAMLEGRRNRPESLTRAEQGLADLARANIEAQQREAEDFRREAMERRDAGLARAQQSIWSNPQAMLALAGGIDTRRGQGVGSFARGLANIMGQQEGMAEAARKEYAQAQQMQRTLDAAIRNTQVLEAQRQLAMQQADFARVSQLDDQIQNSRAAEEAAKRAIRDKAIEQARLERLAVADEGRTRAALISAGRENEMDFYRRDPEGYAKFKTAQYGPRNDGRLEIAKERNEIARQNLLAKDQAYQMASMRYNMATDPAKKAQAAAVMREIERRNGIVTEDEQTTSAATQLPAGVKVTRVGP